MKNKVKYIVLTLFLIILIVSSVPKFMQNDTYFTIATGNDIMTNGYDNYDHLTWHDNLKFDKLRWGFDITIANIYNLFGFDGIYIFILIGASITAITMFWILKKNNTNTIVAFIATGLAVYTIANCYGFTGRAQLISFFILLLSFYSIEQLVNTGKKKYYLYIFLLTIILVNVHASVWIMMLILVLPYLAEALMNKAIKKKKNKNQRFVIRDIKIKPLIIAILLIVLGGFISPIGTTTYTYMIRTVYGLSSVFIQELQRMTIAEGIPTLIINCVFIILLILTKTKIRISDILLIEGLTFMSLYAIRNQFYVYLFGTIVVTRVITDFIKENDKDKAFEKIEKNAGNLKTLSIIGIIIIIISLFGIKDRVKETYDNEKYTPEGAVRYIKENIDYKNKRIFNHFDFGSYLELNGIPAFIDSRSEIYCKEFNDTEILQDWYNLVRGNVDYNEIFEKYDIDYAILYNTEIVNIYIQKDENYKKVYSDDSFSIYEKIEE